MTDPWLPIVSCDLWQIAETVPEHRRLRLLRDAPAPSEVIERLAQAAAVEAKACKLEVKWITSTEMPCFARIEASFRVTAEVFDWFFNGRTGYRAAYWVSAQHGLLFNAAAITAMEPAIGSAAQEQRSLPVSLEQARASLLGQDSKIWAPDPHVCEDGWGKKGLLLPDRWRHREYGYGTCLPMPEPPYIEVKGTFLDADERIWLSCLKQDRHQRLHATGFT